MNNTMKMMLALMAGAMVFTACSSDDIIENIENNEVAQESSQLKPMTFTAEQEGQGTTRATIDGLDIKWTANDKISIFDGASENAGVQMFTIENGAGTTSATFTGSATEADTYYALYPYAVGTTSTPRVPTEDEAKAAAGDPTLLDMWSMYIKFDDEDMVIEAMEMFHISAENQAIILAYLKHQEVNMVTPGVELDGDNIKNVVIPAEQTATAGSADPKAMIMVAKGDDKDALQFKNVCAFVKVTPQFDCAAICLKSNGDEKLAGKIDINYNNGEPTTTVTADGTSTVYLVGTISTGNAYYIAVRPEALTAGFTIEFLTADKNTYYARSTSNTLALSRSNVKNLGEFATNGSWTTTLATSGNDGGHSWQLLSPGIKLATSHACISEYTSAAATSWGADWVLPTKDDCELLCAQKCITYSGSTLTICGAGVLRYVGNIVISGNSEGGMWSSTLHNESLKTHFSIDLKKGIVDWKYDNNWSYYMIFKYTN